MQLLQRASISWILICCNFLTKEYAYAFGLVFGSAVSTELWLRRICTFVRARKMAWRSSFSKRLSFADGAYKGLFLFLMPLYIICRHLLHFVLSLILYFFFNLCFQYDDYFLSLCWFNSLLCKMTSRPQNWLLETNEMLKLNYNENNSLIFEVFWVSSRKIILSDNARWTSGRVVYVWCIIKHKPKKA